MTKTATIKCNLKSSFITVLLIFFPLHNLMAEQSLLIIDDRHADNFSAISGNEWRLVTDGVMGGVSKGRLTTHSIEGRKCLRMQGNVKLDNNGGFIQIALNLSDNILENVTNYKGLIIDVYGNGEAYNIHLRTKDNWLPWQSYRTTFNTASEWKTLRIPFDDFKPYKIRKALNIGKLKRIGLVAIGREFNADLCVGNIGLYR